ncbi:hypothetical protein RI129_009830 [Pyrocoelia pectoralis]|uniref:Uncharacterized protein n=1 Tax=Pyrocoelia pectoralis TaxID=417401 RepID=A0AAN7V963_9COLE
MKSPTLRCLNITCGPRYLADEKKKREIEILSSEVVRNISVFKKSWNALGQSEIGMRKCCKLQFEKVEQSSTAIIELVEICFGNGLFVLAEPAEGSCSVAGRRKK